MGSGSRSGVRTGGRPILATVGDSSDTGSWRLGPAGPMVSGRTLISVPPRRRERPAFVASTRYRRDGVEVPLDMPGPFPRERQPKTPERLSLPVFRNGNSAGSLMACTPSNTRELQASDASHSARHRVDFSTAGARYLHERRTRTSQGVTHASHPRCTAL